VVDPSAVCSNQLPLPGVHLLALSADQQLLACVAGRAVHLYSLAQLLAPRCGAAAAPLHTLELAAEALDFAWCPSGAAEELGSFLALTADRQLQHGSLGGGAAALAERVDAFAWAPDGQHLAYSSGAMLVVTAPDWRDTGFKVAVGTDGARELFWGAKTAHGMRQGALAAAQKLGCTPNPSSPLPLLHTHFTKHPPKPAAPGDPVIESVRWVAPRAILASLLSTNPADEDDTNESSVVREEDDVVYMGVTWEGWDGTAGGTPEGLAVTELGLYYMGVSNGGGWMDGWGGWVDGLVGRALVGKCAEIGLVVIASRLASCPLQAKQATPHQPALRLHLCTHQTNNPNAHSTTRSTWAAATAAGRTSRPPSSKSGSWACTRTASR